MSEQDFWNRIPHGENDPPRLFYDPSKTLTYDFNEKDTQYVMFSRALEGCFVLPFTKPMQEGYGSASVHGIPIPCTVACVSFGEMKTWWLGLDLGGQLSDYSCQVTVHVSGFRDIQGNSMVPVDLKLCTPPKIVPDQKDQVHEQVALWAARDGIVLLKNENRVLPFQSGKTLNFFGKGIYNFRTCAVGAGKIYPRYTKGLLEAVREDKSVKVNEELLSFYACGTDAVPPESLLENGKKQSDTAIMVLSRVSGENTDNSSDPGEYYLSEDEEKLLAVLRKNFKKLVVILNTGYPISLEFADKYCVDGVIYNGYGGMLAGPALMDVLTGRVNPSGKLPDTWSVNYDSIPASRNFYDCSGKKKRLLSREWVDTVYEEDIYVGYRYFETFPTADQRGLPFGYGLSYTQFSMSCQSLKWDGTCLQTEIQVKNTGHMPGREVVQLYVSKPDGTLEQPAMELMEFEKTKLLNPGEDQTLNLMIPERRMTSYDPGLAAYVMVPGVYRVYLGGDVRHCRKIGEFHCPELRIIKQVKNRMTLNRPVSFLSRKDPEKTFPSGAGSGIVSHGECPWVPRKSREHFDHQELSGNGGKITYKDVLEDPSLLEAFVGNMDVKTMARICVCASDGWGMEGRGEAGRLYRPDGLELPEFIVADGNSGVNLKTRNIGMPSGASLCASFDKALMEQVGRVIGEEAKALNIQLILAPAMNLHRNPLNGRQPEYFSEDPYLSGTMAGYYCKGLESTGVGGCYKHLMGNNAESGRKRNQSIISERAIRELYFKTFEYALEIHEPVSVMTAYNGVNGVFTSCDSELIQGLLFEEQGFSGFVMTDWTSYESASVAQMAEAGNSWITPGSEDSTYTDLIEKAVAHGQVSVAQLQENVRRLIYALIRLNLK